MLHLFVYGYEESSDFGMFMHVEGETQARAIAKEFDPPLSEEEWYLRECWPGCDYPGSLFPLSSHPGGRDEKTH